MAKEQVHSPIFKQFTDLKAKHPYATLLFRCGDFYETYNEDAKAIAEILGITLTTSRKYMDLQHMAGFPHHALDTYLPKLVRAGKRVAIVDQLEDPKDKKLVKRGVTDIISNNNSNNSTQMATTTDNSKEQIAGIAVETLKALKGMLPTSLNKRFADALGMLPFIQLKYNHNAEIFQDEMNYLIKYAEIGLNAENGAK